MGDKVRVFDDELNLDDEADNWWVGTICSIGNKAEIDRKLKITR